MDSVNQTLYIPLYGKAYVSRKGVILRDKKAEQIWDREAFPLKGKSKSRWLAYYLAMRAAVFDQWLREKLAASAQAIVLHVGCGLDSRADRVGVGSHQWYDLDFPEVIQERDAYYQENEQYHMVAVDMRRLDWTDQIDQAEEALVVLEGVSMYFQPEELETLLQIIRRQFHRVHILMDCYTERGARASRVRNPIQDVGVTRVYGFDHPQQLAESAGLTFVREHDMTPAQYVDQLQGMERRIFRLLFGGSFARSIYRMYEFENGPHAQTCVI